MNSAPTWQGVTIPNPLRLFVILPEKYLTGLLAGGAFAPYELFAAGKTSAQGEFISPEDFLSSGAPEKALLFWDGDPYRIRTDVNGVRGRCLNHLTNGPCLASWGPHWMVLPSSGMVHLQGLEPWTP